MRLGNILRQKAQPIAPRPVQFWIVGRDDSFKQKKALVTACLVYLDEEQREQLRVEALVDLRKRFPDKTIPEAVVHDEMNYRKLFEVLRDEEESADGQHQRFADTLLELRQALTIEETERLLEEYDRYVKEEFPPRIPDDEFATLVEEAKKNSALDLLTSHGFESAIQVMSFLAGRSSRSLTPT